MKLNSFLNLTNFRLKKINGSGGLCMNIYATIRSARREMLTVYCRGKFHRQENIFIMSEKMSIILSKTCM